ncbi:MAG: hypothetical protein V3S30_08125 [Thermoanaerobaculia bacterium]
MPIDPKITNTSKQHPARHLMGAMAAHERTGSTDQFHLDQEAQGQRDVVAAAGTRLPSEGTIRNRMGDPIQGSVTDVWKSYGLVFGKPVKDDEIWVEAILPDGWKIESTDHSMWSKLVDDKGRARALIFYKAAFYDRSCHIQLNRRFAATMDQPERPGPFFGIVTDGGTEIERLGPFEDDEGTRPSYIDDPKDLWKSGDDKSLDAAKAWLGEHYPDWNEHTAYWD